MRLELRGLLSETERLTRDWHSLPALWNHYSEKQKRHRTTNIRRRIPAASGTESQMLPTHSSRIVSVTKQDRYRQTPMAKMILNNDVKALPITVAMLSETNPE